MPQSFVKDPDATLDYQVDWTTWLSGDSDTISSSTWTISGSGLTEDSSSNTTQVATIWLSGGTEGSSYEVTNRIITANGRTADRTIYIVIDQR